MNISLIDLIDAADRPTTNPCPDGPQARRVRKLAGVSPTNLAAAVGMAERTLLTFERKPNHPVTSAAVRLRLCRVLNFLAEQNAGSK
tara:strand:- start:199 stop:459 length:261 start_codon:yes stop_codon:yes gene_type:complete